MSNNGKRGAQRKFVFSPYLQRYLEEKSKIENMRTDAEKAGRQLSKIDERRIRRNNETKFTILENTIFPSIANIIYFFEYIYEHHELEGIFDNDVQDLLGLRGSHVKRHKKGDGNYLVFLRLLYAILNYDGDDETVTIDKNGVVHSDPRNRKAIPKKRKEQFDISRNIRLQLAKQAAECITEVILNLGAQKDWTLATKIMSDYLGKAQFWAEYCTSDMKLNTGNPHRLIGF